MLSETVLLAGKSPRKFICPICKIERCGKHCNSCQKELGVDIEWKSIDNRWRLCDIGTENPHYCMKKGTGRFIKNGMVYEQGQKAWKLYQDLDDWEVIQVNKGRYHFRQMYFNDADYRKRHMK